MDIIRIIRIIRIIFQNLNNFAEKQKGLTYLLFYSIFCLEIIGNLINLKICWRYHMTYWREDDLNRALRIIPICCLKDAVRIIRESGGHPGIVELFLSRKDWKNIEIGGAVLITTLKLSWCVDIVLSVVSRSDCPVEDAICLTLKNNDCRISDMVFSTNVWKEISFQKLIELAEKSGWNYRAINIIASKDEWKKMSFEHATELVKKSKFALSVVCQFVLRDDCSLERAIELAKLKDLNLYIAEAITSRSDWKNLPLDEAVEMFQLSDKNSDWNNHFIYSAILRDDCSLEKAITLAKMTSSSDGAVFDFRVTKLIASRDDWKKLTPDEITRLGAWGLYRWMDIRGFIPKK